MLWPHSCGMSDTGVSEVEDLTTSPARAGTSTRVADPHRSPLKRGWAEVFANPKAKKKTKPLHPHGIISGEAARKTAPITMPIFQIHVNAATNERFFSQTGLTHTRLRNRLAAATVTKIAQLRAELNRSKPPRKKPRIVSQSQPSASSSSQGPGG